MGYNTKLEGVLKFKNEISIGQLQKLSSILGEDCRKHPEWNMHDAYYIALELTSDYKGLEHDGSEKTYDMPGIINLVIDQMQKEFPDFELEGKLLAQGEEVGDVYYVVIENGRAVQKDINIDLNNTGLPKLNIANRDAHDLGEALGIPLARQNEISDKMDEMINKSKSEDTRLVYAIDIIEYIHGLCNTQEEFIYAFTNHTMWLVRTGRMFTTGEAQDKAIKNLGNPTRL